VPDIAGEVGSGDGDLETPRRILSSTHGRARREPDPSPWYNLEGPPYFRRGDNQRGRGTRAHKGDGGGKRTRRDGPEWIVSCLQFDLLPWMNLS